MIIACIPCYNDHGPIVNVIKEALKHVDRVLVIDDGSTPSLMKTLPLSLLRNKRLILVRNRNRMGYGFCIKEGLVLGKRFRARIIVFLDADGQHNPNEIPKIVKAILSENISIAIGNRFLGGSATPPLDRFLIKLISLFLSLLIRRRIGDALCGYRAFNIISIKSFKVLNMLSDDMGIALEMLALFNKLGGAIKEIPVKVKYDEQSKRPLANKLIQFNQILVSLIRVRLLGWCGCYK